MSARGRIAALVALAGAAAILVPVPGAVPVARTETWSGLGAGRRLGEPAWAENLTVWPVLAAPDAGVPEFDALAPAIAKGQAVVREEAEAEVNRVRIENKGSKPLLILAGTILKGGRQDRQVGRDVVVEAGGTAEVDAFCVERSRWTPEREGRDTGGVFQVLDTMTTKRVRVAGQHGKNQHDVWGEVGKVNHRAGKAPATGTHLSAIEEGDAAARRYRERLESAVRTGLGHGKEQVVGFAYAVDGEPMTVRVFASHALFVQHFEPYLKTMTLEALLARRRDEAARRPPFAAVASVELVKGLVDAINAKDASRGGHAALAGASGGRVVTEDWTASAEVAGATRQRLESLHALGYTQ